MIIKNNPYCKHEVCKVVNCKDELLEKMGYAFLECELCGVTWLIEPNGEISLKPIDNVLTT